MVHLELPRELLHERQCRVAVVGENGEGVTGRGIVGDERLDSGESAVVADPAAASECVAKLEAIPVLGRERLRCPEDLTPGRADEAVVAQCEEEAVEVGSGAPSAAGRSADGAVQPGRRGRVFPLDVPSPEWEPCP